MTRLHTTPAASKTDDAGDDLFPYRYLQQLRDNRRRLGIDKHHLLVIFTLATRGMKSWPGADTIAEDTGLSPRKVEDVIADLRTRGLLATTPRGRGTFKDLSPLVKRLDDLRTPCGSELPTPAHHAGVTSAHHADEGGKLKEKPPFAHTPAHERERGGTTGTPGDRELALKPFFEEQVAERRADNGHDYRFTSIDIGHDIRAASKEFAKRYGRKPSIDQREAARRWAEKELPRRDRDGTFIEDHEAAARYFASLSRTQEGDDVRVCEAGAVPDTPW